MLTRTLKQCYLWVLYGSASTSDITYYVTSDVEAVLFMGLVWVCLTSDITYYVNLDVEAVLFMGRVCVCLTSDITLCQLRR